MRNRGCESIEMINLKKEFKLGDIFLQNFIELSKEKRDIVRNWRNHESIRKWMYSDSIISPEEHANFIDRLYTDNSNYYWVVHSQKGEYIGVISLNRVDFSNKNAYIGIYSNPDCKLKGKGRLLIMCLKKLAFNIARLHTIKLEVIGTNEQAINFYKKLGFSEEGRLKEFVFKNGKWLDAIIMGIIDRDEENK